MRQVFHQLGMVQSGDALIRIWHRVRTAPTLWWCFCPLSSSVIVVLALRVQKYHHPPCWFSGPTECGFPRCHAEVLMFLCCIFLRCFRHWLAVFLPVIDTRYLPLAVFVVSGSYAMSWHDAVQWRRDLNQGWTDCITTNDGVSVFIILCDSGVSAPGTETSLA